MDISMSKEKPRKRRLSLRQKRRRRERFLLVGGGIALVLAVAEVLYLAFRPLPGTKVPSLGNQHIEPPQKATYNSMPPTSGPHYESIAPWGVHEVPIPNELQVHNLEDGGVMVQYNCPDGCADLVQQLASAVDRFSEGVILAPYPDMEARIALTAWGRIDTMDEFDEKRILTFIRAHRGRDHHVAYR
jgi:hypothetical protein